MSEAIRPRYRLKCDHVSYSQGNIYATKGDIVELVKEEDNISIYQDATGERFSSCSSSLQKVPDGTKLKKQVIPAKSYKRTN